MNSTPRAVVLVTAVVPVPRDSGKKVVLAGLIDYWTERLGAGRVHLALVGSQPDDAAGLSIAVHRVGGPSRSRQVFNVATMAVTGRRSLQEAALYSPSVRRRVAEVVERTGADLVVYDTIRMAQLAPALPRADGVRRVVYLDDLFSVRYARMLELLRTAPDARIDPLGDFGQHLPSVARWVVARPGARRVLLRWEGRLTARRERAAAARFESVFLISPEEVRRLAASLPGARVLELPPTIDTPPAASAAPDLRVTGRPTFVLMGLLTLAHNVDAAEVFLDQCLPGLLEAVPDARVHIVGRGAPESLLHAAARHPGVVTVDGFVPDLDELLNGATALVMPLRFGSGIKIKLLEALGRGLPVVSTPVGAEGVESGAGNGIVIEADPEQFAPHLFALTDAVHRERVSRAARAHFERRYARTAAFSRYDIAFGVP